MWTDESESGEYPQFSTMIGTPIGESNLHLQSMILGGNTLLKWHRKQAYQLVLDRHVSELFPIEESTGIVN